MSSAEDATLPLRAATATDLPMILRGERLYLREIEPESVERWTAALDRNLELWIANLDRTGVLEAEGAPAGYAMWMPRNGGAALVTMPVLPPHRRHGFGARLLGWFAADAAAAGIRRLDLGVHRENPARWLYERDGYRLTGEDGDYLLYSRETA
ncbi:GNAT family N-acetyltransferase [Frigoribacterium sp. UYMn621]|uniref:GNAT family N-acetyltransferase n=1 Tax=Frigoribacterium sp. UYMn621 TaxID=3156343 RepID=UPI003394916A